MRGQGSDLSFIQSPHFGLMKHNQDHEIAKNDTIGGVQPDIDLGQCDGDLFLARTHNHEMNLFDASNEAYENQNVYHEGDEQSLFGDYNNPDIDLGQASDDGIKHGSEGDFLLAQTLDHEMPLSHAGNEDYESQNLYHEGEEQSILGESNDPDIDQGDVGMENHERQLVLAGENHEHQLVLAGENHERQLVLAGENHKRQLVLAGENHERQLVLAGENHELDILESHDLAIIENHGIDENMELVAYQNHEMGIVTTPDLSVQQAQFVVASPVVQARTLVPAPTYDLYIGQEFPDASSCRRALRDVAIALHFEMQTVKSDKIRFTAKCASEGCPWRLHAAKLPGFPTFTIRTISGEHTCSGITHLGHQQASAEWVANSLEQRLVENPNYKPKEMLEDIHRKYGITLSYKQAWRAKERIVNSFRCSLEEDYRLLPQYCEQIKRTNPGSIALVYVNPVDNCFQRLFVSFHASIFGFVNACRPLIGLDRIILKNKYLGTLLFATAFDGNGDLFPLAFGVVDEESNENWMWFLSEMHDLLEKNSENMPKLTILSNRQKGLIEAVDAKFPTAFHGFCVRHLSESLRKEFNDTMLINLLWEAANALTDSDYDAKINEIGEMSPDAACWIRQVPPRLWANAFFEGTRFGHLTANILEPFNSWITEAVGLPIVQMMECIRRQLMTWFNERRESSTQWTSILVPPAERYVAEAIERASTYQVLRSDESRFKVISLEGINTVNIQNRSCSCRGWQVNGLPCAHAVATLLSCRQNVHRFSESCFTVTSYQKAYSKMVHPIPERTLWETISEGSQDGEVIIVNPPRSLQPPAQPRRKKARTDDSSRAKRVVHCSRCNQTGHFRTTCQAPL